MARSPTYVSPACALAEIVTDAIEALCKRVNEHRPGDPFTHEHSLDFIPDLISENGAVLALLQRCWCRKVKEKGGQPGRRKTGDFGFLNVGRPQLSLSSHCRRRLRRTELAPGSAREEPAEAEEDAVPLTGSSSYTFVPSSAYDIFARNEAAKLRKDGNALTTETWRALGAAWKALSSERRAAYQEQLLANPAYANSRVLSSCCAYQCPRGASGLSHCEGCDRADVSGHPECFLAHLEQHCGEDHACEACYLCPRCLQQHLRAVRLEPAAPSEVQLAAIEQLIGGRPLQVQLAEARSAGLPGASRGVLKKYVVALQLLADDARLQDTSAYANVNGALNGLLIAEFFRDGSTFAAC
jgi:hypothetical protein